MDQAGEEGEAGGREDGAERIGEECDAGDGGSQGEGERMEESLKAYEDKMRAELDKGPLTSQQLWNAHQEALAAAKEALGTAGGGGEGGEGGCAAHQLLETAILGHSVGAPHLMISGGTVRFVEVRDASSGGGVLASAVQSNWQKLAKRAKQEWDKAYEPVAAKARAEPCGFDTLESFNAEAEGARSAFAEGMGELAEESWAAVKDLTDHVVEDRQRVSMGISRKELAQLRQEMQTSAQGAKDAHRRELKLVLDRTRKVEEQLQALIKSHGEGEAGHQPPSAPPPGAEGSASGASIDAEAMVKAQQRLESLESLVGNQGGGLAEQGAGLAETREKLEALAKAVEEGRKAAKADLETATGGLDEATRSLKEGLSCVGDTAEDAMRLGQQVRAMLGETEARLSSAAARQEDDVARRCRVLFDVLSERQASGLSGVEVRISADARATASKAAARHQELVGFVQAECAESAKGIADLSGRISSAMDEIESLWTKTEQSRDQIQALFKILEGMPNAENLKDALKEASSYIPGKQELSSAFSAVKRKVSAGMHSAGGAVSSGREARTPPQPAGRGAGRPPLHTPPDSRIVSGAYFDPIMAARGSFGQGMMMGGGVAEGQEVDSDDE